MGNSQSLWCSSGRSLNVSARRLSIGFRPHQNDKKILKIEQPTAIFRHPATIAPHFEIFLIPSKPHRFYRDGMPQRKTLLLPADLPSAPKVPTVLLRLLTLALLLCIAAAMALYLYWTFSNLVSSHRREMNAAAYNAQLFFDRREAMLRSLRNSAVSELEKAANAPPYVSDTRVSVIPLDDGEGSSRWTLFVTPRDLRDLDRNHTRLIYAPASRDLPIVPIWPQPKSSAATDPSRLLWLSSALAPYEKINLRSAAAHIVWLRDPDDAENRLYMFTPLDSNDTAGWLGLEVLDIEGGIDFSNLHQTRYVLLDREGDEVLHNRIAPELVNSISRGMWKDSFGFYGGEGQAPEYLALSKTVGEAGWRLVYCIPLHQLLVDSLVAVRLALGLCLVLTIGVLLGVRRINIKLLRPALKQYDELVESLQFSRTVIETAPVALCMVSRKDGSVALANELARTWLHDDADWHDIVLTNLSHGTHSEFELRDGRSVYMTFAPTRYRGEEVLLCAFSDVTARRQVEASLLQAKAQADAANTAKTIFLTTMSHEIRTPLYGILGTLELFSLGPTTRQQAQYLETMQKSSSALLRTINDTLDISRIEAGHLELESLVFSPLAMVEEVVGAYAARAEHKGLRTYVWVDDDIPHCVIGDVNRIRQILNNLMSNAIKFTESGQVVLRLRLVGTDNNQATLSFQVVDTGVGIPAQHQSNLFQPFYQVANAQNVVKGTGLGLSICWRLAQLMDGSMNVISEPGLGTSLTFTIALPVQSDQFGHDTPALQATPVYVRSGIKDVATNLCAWLRRWGAQALPYHAGMTTPVPDAVLVDVWYDDQDAANAWSGPRVIGLPSAPHRPEKQDGRWIVNAYSLRAIGQAVKRAQNRGQHYPILDIAAASGALSLSVLVVEDNAINQLILKEQLEYLGCKVQLVNNGQEALDLRDVLEYQVVLTDINMPLINGYELATALRARGYKAPIFGISANAFPEEIQRCTNAGMTSLLTKPLPLPVLRRALQSIRDQCR